MVPILVDTPCTLRTLRFTYLQAAAQFKGCPTEPAWIVAFSSAAVDSNSLPEARSSLSFEMFEEEN